MFRLGIFCVHDLRAFSSIPYYLVRTWRAVPGVEVVLLPAGAPYRPGFGKRLGCRLERQLTGRTYLWEKEPARCRHISRQLDAAVAQHPVDAVLLFGSEGCAFSETKVPLFCYADSLFGSRLGLYPDQRADRVPPRSLREGFEVQQRGLDRLAKLFLSSRWALERAVNQFGYTVPAGRVEVVGIGANLPAVPPRPVAAADRDGAVSFLWVGGDWERKGGLFAAEVVERLREMGFDARLDVVGAVRPERTYPWLTAHGRLSYEDPGHFQRLGELYARAVALLLPTVADLTPIAICEAFAFGRPVIAAPVGGIPEMIEDGRTGLLLTRDTPARWAEKLAASLRTGVLPAMGAACRGAFERTWNWDAVCSRIRAALGVM